jgi:hypothetical protein
MDVDAGITTGGRQVGLTLPEKYERLLHTLPYRPFLSEGTQLDARLVIRVVSDPQPDPDRPVWDYPEVVQRQLSHRMRVDKDELFWCCYGVADFVRRSTWLMESFVFESADEDQCLRSQLFRLLGSLLSASDGVMLHGSGFVMEGVAAAVIGPSEAGKTTAARLIRGERLLSDDVVAVTDIDTQPLLHATPLGRESDGVGSAPLRAIFFPRKQAAFSLQPLTARQALIRSATEQADNLQRLFVPSDGMAIRNLGRLFRKVPAYELGFSLDGIDREAIRRVLSGS